MALSTNARLALQHEMNDAAAAAAAEICDAINANAAALTGESMILNRIPTSDPGVAGQVWSKSGVLMVSTG